MTDPYHNPDALPPATIDAIITRLEERGRHPFFLQAINQYASALERDRKLSVLELGCGTGVVIRHIETLLHPSSALRAADISLQFLQAAKDRAAKTSRIEWDLISPTASLPYADEQFDVVIMHTLLSHVPDTAAILSQAHRILRPAGRLIVFDADHISTSYSLPDVRKGRDIDFKLVSAISTHPAICRQMPLHLKRAGFELKSHVSHLLSECGRGDFWLSSVRGFARLIPAMGILPEEEGREWVDHMVRSHDDGTFFASGAFYTYHAAKC